MEELWISKENIYEYSSKRCTIATTFTNYEKIFPYKRNYTVLNQEQLVNILKEDKHFEYFLEAKEIVIKTINEDIYTSKTKTNVLRSAEFCKRVKENTRKYLEQKNKSVDK